MALADRDLVDLVGLAVQEDMNLVALEVMADMGLENPADRASLRDLVGLEDMSLVGPVGLGVREGMNLAALEDRASLGARDRVDPVGLEDLSQGPAQMGRNLAHLGRVALSRAHRRRNLPDLHPTLAHLHLHRTRDHPPELTHPEVAAHLPVRTHPAAAIHPAEATHLAEATHPGEATREADTEGVKPRYREFNSQSSGFGQAARNCLGAPGKTVCITAPADAGCPARQVRFLRSGVTRAARLSPS